MVFLVSNGLRSSASSYTIARLRPSIAQDRRSQGRGMFSPVSSCLLPLVAASLLIPEFFSSLALSVLKKSTSQVSVALPPPAAFPSSVAPFRSSFSLVLPVETQSAGTLPAAGGPGRLRCTLVRAVGSTACHVDTNFSAMYSQPASSLYEP